MPKKPLPVDDHSDDEDLVDDDEEGEGMDMIDLQQALMNAYFDLPPVVRKRLDAIENLHNKYMTLYEEKNKEIEAIELKYHKLFAPIFDKRGQIASGAYQPTDEEAHVEKKKEEMEDEKEKEKPKMREAQPEDDKIKGVPEFWLTVFQNNRPLSQAIEEQDEDALKYLSDVKETPLEGEGQNGFTISFTFSENPYFTNTVLTKTFHLASEGPFDEYVDHSIGTKIDWKAGKNLTVKSKKEKTKAKKGKPSRVKIVSEPIPSFFNFFDSHEIKEEDEEDPDKFQVMESEYDMGLTIKEKLIPLAFLWYTGEAAEFDDYDDFDMEDDDEEGDDDDEEEEDDDEEEEEAPRKKGGNPKKERGGGAGPAYSFAAPPGAKNAPNPPQQPECKQQ